MTDCSRCGLCCIDISIQKSPADFEAWFEGFDFDGSDRGSSLYDAWFIQTFWDYEGPDKTNGHKYQCSQFNRETKECMAHDSRPNVCVGYPWYGREPQRYNESLHPQCSFNAEVRTMLPIVEIR